MLVRLLVALGYIACASCYIMGVDMGSDTMKVSLVQSGKPLQIVTNFESKRKTPTAIGFYKNERLYGANGIALLPRKPEVVYVNPLRLVGRTPDHPLVKEMVNDLYFPYDVYTNSTNGLTYIKEAGQVNVSYTPEELTAMILLHAKEIVAATGGQPVKDAVITVPSSFTQHEREGVYAAAAIADLNVLSLVEENTAAALQYAIDHGAAFGDAERTVLFYNLGATTTQASIVKYSTFLVKESKTVNKTISQFEVLGKGFDTQLGGLHIDVKVAELLANRFNVEWNKAKPKGEVKDIKKNIKIMSKLRQEANKLKEVLSVNAEYPVKLEQLFDDVSLTTKVTRKELEALCEKDDIAKRAIVPIEMAIENAGIDMQSVDVIELLGGGFRVPLIKKALEDHLKNFPKVPKVNAADENATEAAPVSSAPVYLELGQHLNADESMTLGAAFRGANSSTSFRVRKIGLVDTLNYGVAVKLQEDLSAPAVDSLSSASATSGAQWKKQTVVFPTKTSLLVKPRTVAFNYDKDITCEIVADTEHDSLIPFNKDNEVALGGDALFAKYSISGIAQFVADMTEKGNLGNADTVKVDGVAPSQPKVHLTFALDGQSGTVYLTKAEVTLEIPKPVVPVVENITDVNATAEANTGDNATDSADSAKKDEKEEKKKEEKKKKEETSNTIRKTLKVVEHRDAVVPPVYTAEQIKASRSKLQSLLDADLERKQRENALNDLETDIYKIRNSFNDVDADKVAKVARESTIASVIQQCNDLEEWLYEDGRTVEMSVFVAKKKELNALVAPVYKRIAELTALPEAITKAKASITDLRNKVSEWELKLPHVLANETEAVVAEITRYEKWLEEREARHALVSPYGDETESTEVVADEADSVKEDTVDVTTKPKVLDSKEVLSKLKPVNLIFKKYNSKPLPKPEKVIVTDVNATDSNSTNSTVIEEEEVTRNETESNHSA